MTYFARYYQRGELVEVGMNEIEELIKEEKNKVRIAELIYYRYYERYLKIFFYEDKNMQGYKSSDKNKSVFTTEYKNGFSIMANCCLLIETLSSFFDGINETPRGKGKDSFKSFFAKAKEYENELRIFENESDFYYAVRCGILHQGETKKKFKIRRNGKLFENDTINATIFCKSLKDFLCQYTKRLSEFEKWEGDIWDKCRIKLRHIIRNS
jgi:hypothetical protein